MAVGVEEPPRGELRGERWPRRAVSSVVVRGAVLAVPLAAGFAAALAVAGALPPAHGLVATVGWYTATLAASVTTVFLVDRLARRLLPLAALLRLTLVFPDRAPSRLAVALAASSRWRLDTELRRADGADPNVRTLVTLAASLNNHDRRTRGHSERTRALAELIGAQLGLSSDDTDRLRWVAFLHDIGKTQVPAQLLNKRGRLSDAEWATMQRHPAHGAALAEPMRPWLGDWLEGIEQHHERYDGTGYPHGLARGQISLAARIVAVADSFETMTAVRTYNRPMTVVEARRELVRCAGSHFDPTVVRGLLKASIGRVRWTVGVAAWIAELPILGVPTHAGAELVASTAALQPATQAVVGALLFAVAGVTPAALPVVTPASAASPSTPSTATVVGRGPTAPASTSAAPAGTSAAPAEPTAAALSSAGPTATSTTTTTTAPAPSVSPPPPGGTVDPSPSSDADPHRHDGDHRGDGDRGGPGRDAPGRDDGGPSGHDGSLGHPGDDHR